MKVGDELNGIETLKIISSASCDHKNVAGPIFDRDDSRSGFCVMYQNRAGQVRSFTITLTASDTISARHALLGALASMNFEIHDCDRPGQLARVCHELWPYDETRAEAIKYLN